MIGREFEQARLLERYKSVQSEFVVVYGRRRVGKTFLVRETFANKFAFQHTGQSKGGAMCIMRKLGGGDLNGKTILVQRNDESDPESGGAYTIKTFMRKGKGVVLKARNPEYDIPLENDAEYSQRYRAIAEFKCVC